MNIQGLVLDVDGVLSDGTLFYGERGELSKGFHARDGLGLVWLRQHGVRLALLSGRNSPAVDARADELQLDPVLLGRPDKAKALDEICAAWDLRPEVLAAVGDDLVDLPMLQRVAWSFAPADAHELVRRSVKTVTEARGGHGAVREVCEYILKARGEWAPLLERYGLVGDS